MNEIKETTDQTQKLVRSTIPKQRETVSHLVKKVARIVANYIMLWLDAYVVKVDLGWHFARVHYIDTFVGKGEERREEGRKEVVGGKRRGEGRRGESVYDLK